MFFTVSRVQQFQADGMILDLKVIVAGSHASQPMDLSEGPITEPFLFVSPDTAKPVNVFRGDQGTLTFSVVLYYKFHETKGMLQKLSGTPDEILIQSYGNRVYECSFDYSFPQEATSTSALVLEPPNKSQLSSDSEDDEDLTVELGAWNDRQGSPGGPKYIRINPFINVPLNAKSRQLGLSVAVPPLTASAQAGATRSMAARSSDTGIGTFTVPIHPLIITSSTVDVKEVKGATPTGATPDVRKMMAGIL